MYMSLTIMDSAHSAIKFESPGYVKFSENRVAANNVRSRT
jgi:hypothetical protein